MAHEQIPQTEQPPAPRPLSLWRNRDYVVLWSGQIVSNLGDEVGEIAAPLLILALTGSPAQAGAVFALQQVMFLILSLPAGALVDRWDRKRVMIVCDAGRGLATASVPIALWTGHLSMVQLYVVAALLGIFSTLFNFAEVACLPNVVGKEQIAAATSQNQAANAATGLVGPPIGGFLFGINRAIPFLADAISYVASVASLRLIRCEFQRERRAEPQNLRAEIVEGLRWLWDHSIFRFLAIMNAASNMIFIGNFLIVIVLARKQHASPAAIGAIFAIGSIGGLTGALLGGRIQRRFPFGSIMIACFWGMATLYPLQALAPNPFVLGAIAAGFFFVFPVYNVAIWTYRISLVPDHLLGRVTSSVRLIANGATPLGSIIAGALLQWIGPRATVLVFAAGLLAVALSATANHEVRHATYVASG